jgi:hypothetical protein
MPSQVRHNAKVASLLTHAGLVRVPSLGCRVNHAYVRSDVLARCAMATNWSCYEIRGSYRLPRFDCNKFQRLAAGGTEARVR